MKQLHRFNMRSTAGNGRTPDVASSAISSSKKVSCAVAASNARLCCSSVSIGEGSVCLFLQTYTPAPDRNTSKRCKAINVALHENLRPLATAHRQSAQASGALPMLLPHTPWHAAARQTFSSAALSLGPAVPCLISGWPTFSGSHV